MFGSKNFTSLKKKHLHRTIFWENKDKTFSRGLTLVSSNFELYEILR